jgi:hypothetical protein
MPRKASKQLKKRVKASRRGKKMQKIIKIPLHFMGGDIILFLLALIYIEC